MANARKTRCSNAWAPHRPSNLARWPRSATLQGRIPSGATPRHFWCAPVRTASTLLIAAFLAISNWSSVSDGARWAK
eukprot:5752885-Pyramimonas_sp.AAC.1